jgi:hypothetical protein
MVSVAMMVLIAGSATDLAFSGIGNAKYRRFNSPSWLSSKESLIKLSYLCNNAMPMRTSLRGRVLNIKGSFLRTFDLI